MESPKNPERVQQIMTNVAHTGDVAQVHLGRQHHASQPRGTGSGICPTFTYRLPVVAC